MLAEPSVRPLEDDESQWPLSKYQDQAYQAFSTCQTTEEQFRSETHEFYGAYGYIREQLDHQYHVCYRKERQWLHDSIIEGYLQDGASANPSQLPTDPWLILTVGCQGAGKRYVVETLTDDKRLGLISYVMVDADEISQLLPEYLSFVSKCPQSVDQRTKKESGYIAETLTLATLQMGGNVILNCSLDDPEWYHCNLEKLRDKFSKLRVALLHVTASIDVIMERIEHLAVFTKKTVSREKTVRVLDRIPRGIEVLRGSVDYACVIRNEGDELVINDDNDWSSFQTNFKQSVSLSQHLPAIKRLSTKEVEAHQRDTKRSVRRFSVLVSSEQNHRSDDRNFYGQFAHIRRTLDYEYHNNYTRERQLFQDAIINEFLHETHLKDQQGRECTTPTEPWIVFTAGAMGAGKSYVMKKLVERRHFPLLAFVRADPDEIRRFLPEYHLYIKMNPELAGELTNKESGFITEILTLAGLKAGKNVLVDGSLRDASWYRRYFQELRIDFPSLRLSIIHVTAPRDVVFERAASRAKVTGRVVPRKVLLTAMEQVPKSVELLAPLVNYHVQLDNADEIRIIKPDGEDWQSFQKNWLQ